MLTKKVADYPELTLTNLRCKSCNVSISPHFYEGQIIVIQICPNCGESETFRRPKPPPSRLLSPRPTYARKTSAGDLYFVWGDINNNESFSAILHSNGTWGVGRVGQPDGSCKTFLDALEETEG